MHAYHCMPIIILSNYVILILCPIDFYAAINAILNKSAESLDGCIMYMTKCPKNEEAKVIIQAGIRKVIYFYEEPAENSNCKAAKKLLADAEVMSRW